MRSFAQITNVLKFSSVKKRETIAAYRFFRATLRRKAGIKEGRKEELREEGRKARDEGRKEGRQETTEGRKET